MSDLLSALLLLAAGGLLGSVLALLHRERLGATTGAAFAAFGCALGLRAALSALAGAPDVGFDMEWRVPGAAVRLGIDALSAWFLLPIFGLGGLVSIYGAGYLGHYLAAAGGGHRTKRIAAPILFMNLLLADMALVVTARDAFLFIFAWELMTLLAFLLVSFEDERADVRHAAFVYVAIAHAAAILVVGFILVLARDAGSRDFAAIAAGASGRGALLAGLLFPMALFGFGAKLGLVPVHIWLPQAHPAAPSHVSAVMSGVIVKTALYALLRGLTWLGPARAWWGFTLLGIGVVTALGGILYGLVQGDLKRLLAYSTIENVGIMLIGAGTGLVGAAYGNPAVAALGFAGALLHALNHAVMKGLLFSGAGAVLYASHTRSIDRLGGLLTRMPATGLAFLTGALAIAGLPGLCGFASEFLVYAGLLRGGLELDPVPGAVLVAAVPALAVVGGLAAAALAKAFGLVFLGQPRSDEAARAREVPISMRLPLVILAALAVALGLGAPLVVRAVLPVAGALAGLDPETTLRAVAPALSPLATVSLAGGILFALAGALALARRALLAPRPVVAGRTWGCGYGAPSSRMQYTAASFAQPLAAASREVLRPRVDERPPSGYFPGPSVRRTAFDDPSEERLFGAAVRRVEARMLSLRWLQQGRLSLYVLYIFVALVALLVWQVWFQGSV